MGKPATKFNSEHVVARGEDEQSLDKIALAIDLVVARNERLRLAIDGKAASISSFVRKSHSWFLSKFRQRSTA